MNLKCLHRKCALGIETSYDYALWAGEIDKAGIKSSNILKMVDVLEDTTSLKECFEQALIELSLKFDHPSIEHTPISKTVSSIFWEANKSNKYIYSIDIRPISELAMPDKPASKHDPDSGIFDILDEMAVQCGCIPPGLGWSEFMPELGRQTLSDAFAFDLVFSSYRVLEQERADDLSTQFLSHFSEPLRYFSSASQNPWGNSGGYGSTELTDAFTFSFCIAVTDGKNIGMLVLAGED